jgi:arylsulfatase A-like enzyme
MRRLVLLALSGLLALNLPAQTRRPNIIFIMADDLGYGHLTSYHPGARVPTPHLDALARQGTRFTRFYAGSPVCAPSRCALMTGKHMGHAYIRHNGDVPLRPQDTTLTERLKAAGYVTGMMGKWGLGPEETTGAPQLKGWDECLGYLHHRHAHNHQTDHLWAVRQGQLVRRVVDTTVFTQELFMNEALDFLDRHRDDPFFLYLPFTLVHAELAAPEADIAPFRHPDGRSKLGPETPYRQLPPPSLYRSQPQPHATFAAMLARLDRDVGRLLTHLKGLGLDKNTLVVFTSDNGPGPEGGSDPVFFDGNGPLRGIKREVYEGGIRVPMLVRGPGIPAGRVSDSPFALWDMPATLCEWAGTTAPVGDGHSQVGLWRGRAVPPADRVLFWQYREGTLRQALMQGDWKLVRIKAAGQPEQIELFNLARDLGETTNLAPQEPARVARLRQLMQAAQEPPEHPQFDWSTSER